MSHQAIFLFDLDAFSQIEIHSDEAFQQALTCLRVACLRLLTAFLNHSENFWFGVEFFNRVKVLYKEDTLQDKKHCLQEVNFEAFENLESKLTDRYGRQFLSCKKLYQDNLTRCEQESKTSEKRNTLTVSPFENLVTALKDILAHYTWNSPEICTPVRTKKNAHANDVRKNFVFLFSSCPTSVADFYDTNGLMTHSQLQDFLMPAALYKKFVTEAGISLIWLDTSEVLGDLTVNKHVLEARQLLEFTLTAVRGSFIPIQFLSETYYNCSKENKYINKNIRPEKEKNTLHVCSRRQSLPLPFSQIFSQLISSTHIKEISSVWSCAFVLPDSTSLSLSLVPANSDYTSELKQPSYISPKSAKRKRSFIVKKENQDPVGATWSKLTVYGSVTRGFYGVPNSFSFCHVSGINSLTDDRLVFTEILNSLTRRNEYLVLNCETHNGDTAVGLLCPISNLTAVIGFYNPLCLLDKYPVNGKCSISVKNLGNSLEHFVNEKVEQFGNTISTSCGNPFNPSSVETWFISSRISEISKELHKPKCSTLKEKFFTYCLKSLQREYRQERKRNYQDSLGYNSIRRSPRLKKYENNCLSHSLNSSQTMPISHDVICKSSSGEKMASLPEAESTENVLVQVKEIYETALSASGPLALVTNIVNVIMTFLSTQKAILLKEDLLHFMREHVLTTSKKISELYEERKDPESVARRTKEYQVQILLNLEIETKFPSASSVDSVDTIIALLRGMLLHVGHGKVTQFLRDYIKQNYGHNLHHILLAIEKELNVAIINHSHSSSPVTVASPNCSTMSSMWSADFSGKSSSTVSSRKRSRSVKKSLTNKRAFSTSSLNQKILVSQEMVEEPKQKKPKREPVGIKKSPQFSAETSVSVSSVPKNVSRNLFGTDIKSHAIAGKSSPVCPRKKIRLSPKDSSSCKNELQMCKSASTTHLKKKKQPRRDIVQEMNEENFMVKHKPPKNKKESQETKIDINKSCKVVLEDIYSEITSYQSRTKMQLKLPKELKTKEENTMFSRRVRDLKSKRISSVRKKFIKNFRIKVSGVTLKGYDAKGKLMDVLVDNRSDVHKSVNETKPFVSTGVLMSEQLIFENGELKDFVPRTTLTNDLCVREPKCAFVRDNKFVRIAGINCDIPIGKHSAETPSDPDNATAQDYVQIENSEEETTNSPFQMIRVDFPKKKSPDLSSPCRNECSQCSKQCSKHLFKDKSQEQISCNSKVSIRPCSVVLEDIYRSASSCTKFNRSEKIESPQSFQSGSIKPVISESSTTVSTPQQQIIQIIRITNERNHDTCMEVTEVSVIKNKTGNENEDQNASTSEMSPSISDKISSIHQLLSENGIFKFTKDLCAPRSATYRSQGVQCGGSADDSSTEELSFIDAS